jgi:long-chain acyl-CoA synthetase
VNFASVILEAGRGAPESVAIIDHDGRTYTYEQLLRASAHVARVLEEHGAGLGERVFLIADNSFFWVASYLGCLRAGAVAVPQPPTATPEDVVALRARVSPRAAIVQGKRHARLVEALAGLPTLVDAPPSVPGDVLCFDPGSFSGTERGRVAPAAGGLAALMFTSGSTGSPRGVMVSHDNLAANTASIASYLELTSADRAMAVLPFHYCFGASILHTQLMVGGSLVIDNRFMFVDKVLQRMQDLGCTTFAGVPSHFQILLRKSKLKAMKLPALRCVQHAGGKLSDLLVRELAATIAPAKVFGMYGQTEATARLSYLPPSLIDSKLGSIGRGIPGVVLRVLDDAGAPVSPGQVGEIVAAGKSIAAGYWNDAEATSTTFAGGVLRTGDLATVDAEGFIFIVDRRSDFLKCGGNRTSSRVVEDAVLQLGDVVEAAVIGVPDDLLGEAPIAFVVPTTLGDATLGTRLRDHCAKVLTDELVPKEFIVLEALPRTPSGKVSKPDLRALLRERTAPAEIERQASLSEEFFFKRAQALPIDVWGRNIHLPLRVRGPIDLAALERALNHLVGAHASLRSTFVMGDAGLVKRTRRDAVPGCFLQVVDAPGTSMADLNERLAVDIFHKFDVSAELPLRAKVYRIGPEDHVLGFLFSHLSFDAASYRVALQHLSEAYKAAIELRPWTMAPGLSPDDFAQWQRAVLAGPRAEELRAFWTRYLSRLEGLGVKPRAPAANEVAARRGFTSFSIDVALIAHVRVVTAGVRATIADALAGAVAVLGRRRSLDPERVLIGSVHNLRAQFNMRNRHLKMGLDAVVGLFPHALPICVAFPEGTTWRAVLGDVQRGLKEVALHSDIPLPSLGLAPPPLKQFSAMINYQRMRADFEIAGAEVESLPREPIERDRWKPHHDFEWIIQDTSRGFRGRLIYDESVTSQEEVHRAIEEFLTTLGFTADQVVPGLG